MVAANLLLNVIKQRISHDIIRFNHPNGYKFILKMVGCRNPNRHPALTPLTIPLARQSIYG